MLSQNKMVLRHLKEIGSLTRTEADRLYGITELNTRICNLRKEGHIINSETKSGINRWGKKVNFCEYRLIKEAGTDEKIRHNSNGR